MSAHVGRAIDTTTNSAASFMAPPGEGPRVRYNSDITHPPEVCRLYLRGCHQSPRIAKFFNFGMARAAPSGRLFHARVGKMAPRWSQSYSTFGSWQLDPAARL